MTQLGRYTGWIEAGGRKVSLDGRDARGVRDRSWGVRPIGQSDPQPMVPAPEPQFHWLWVPANFDDCGFLFYLNEDRHGESWNKAMVIAHDDGRVEHLPGAEIAIDYQPGTRWPTRGVIRVPAGKNEYRIEVTAGPRFYMTGIGYMDPEWAHGINKGPLAVGYDEIGVEAGDVYKHALHLHAGLRAGRHDRARRRGAPRPVELRSAEHGSRMPGWGLPGCTTRHERSWKSASPPICATACPMPARSIVDEVGRIHGGSSQETFRLRARWTENGEATSIAA